MNCAQRQDRQFFHFLVVCSKSRNKQLASRGKSTDARALKKCARVLLTACCCCSAAAFSADEYDTHSLELHASWSWFWRTEQQVLVHSGLLCTRSQRTQTHHSGETLSSIDDKQAWCAAHAQSERQRTLTTTERASRAAEQSTRPLPRQQTHGNAHALARHPRFGFLRLVSPSSRAA